MLQPTAAATPGPPGEAEVMLDLIESNMKREYALDGVYQWLFHQLLTPLLTAEILVSWKVPFVGITQHTMPYHMRCDTPHTGEILTATEEVFQRSCQQSILG